MLFKLRYDGPVSNVGFNFNLRRYITGILGALIGFAVAHFAAAGWVPLHMLGDTTTADISGSGGGGGGDGSGSGGSGGGGDVGRSSGGGGGGGGGSGGGDDQHHRLTAAELGLVRATEALLTDLVSSRRAAVMSELVAAGAADHLSRRLISLLGPDGSLLPVGGGGADGVAREATATADAAAAAAAAAAVAAATAAAETIGMGKQSAAAATVALTLFRKKQAAAAAATAATAEAVAAAAAVAVATAATAAEARSLASTLAALLLHNGRAVQV